MAVTYRHNPSTIDTLSTVAHGTYHLMDHPEVYEIQRKNNFELFIQMGALPRTGTDGVYFENPSEKVRLSVSSCKIPHFSQEVIRVRRGNNEIKYAGVPSFEGGSLTVNDYIGTETLDIFYAWQNRSYNVRTEKVGLVEDYKKTAILIEYTPDYQVVRKWKLMGVWINSISEGEFDYENGGKNTINIEFQYDKADIITNEAEERYVNVGTEGLVYSPGDGWVPPSAITQ